MAATVRQPDGTMTLYSYSVGGDGSLTATVATGQANEDGTAIVDGTRSVSVTDVQGRTMLSEAFDVASGIKLASTWVPADGLDVFGRITRTNYLDGTFTSTVYGCCGPDRTTDRDGTVTDYIYDKLRRVTATVRLGITSFTDYDVDGNVVRTSRQPNTALDPEAETVVLSEADYDASGRLIASRDALLRETTYSEEFTVQGWRRTITTAPDGGTRVSVYNQDGSLRASEGTGAWPVRYEYGVGEWTAGSFAAYTQSIRIGPGQDESEWVRSYNDLVGRAFLTVYPDGAAERQWYNGLGQLEEAGDADGVATRYGYNARGEQEYQAVDVNRNGVIDLGGTDRVTRTVSDVVNDPVYGDVRRSRTWVWTSDGQDVSQLVSTSLSSTDGLEAWELRFGQVSHTVTEYGGNGSRTVTSSAPDGTYSVSQYQDGRLASATRYDALGQVVGGTTVAYDGHGRQKTVTDVRTGAITYSYYEDDRVASVTSPDPDGAGPQQPQVTSTVYDSTGRQADVTAPDNGVMHYRYLLTGELAKSWGARGYPVGYTYEKGRMKTLTTWKEFNFTTGEGLGGAAVTTWKYDAARGWLTSKKYDDNKGPGYTYTAAGRLHTRTWARGVVTTYGYSDAGDLESIVYSDATPDVAYTYDRQGRQATVADGAGTRTVSYTQDGQVEGTAHTAGLLAGFGVQYGYDDKLRRNGVQVKQGGNVLTSQGYSYEAGGRIGGVTSGNDTATYGYLAASNLVETVTFAHNGNQVAVTTKSWDNLNRLTATGYAGILPAPSFAYTLNDANQRTRMTLADGSYWAYGYDELGQVIGGKKHFADGTPYAGRQWEYGFDHIGNRNLARAGGDNVGAGLRTATYATNSLNQYTQRTVPGYIDLSGTAAADANVFVNEVAALRQGGYWRRELAVNNVADAIYQAITIAGVKAGAGPNGEDLLTEQTGHAFVPRTPEVFAYDDDGNLLSDGRWTYTWDAENRLIAMAAAMWEPASGRRLRLLFTYDSQSRRCQKQVFPWDAQANDWSTVPTVDLRFLYDDWNLLAEVDAAGNLVRSYAWGLDLSGSFQGAGGIGGLLFETVHTGPNAGTYLACYDGNGNLMNLVSVTDGAVAATYEYSPFGETITAVGPLAAENVFRFSTKYADSETSLLYYGYRYYSPSFGRWVSRDPIGEGGDANVWLFVRNAAAAYIDPLGRFIRALGSPRLVSDPEEHALGWFFKGPLGDLNREHSRDSYPGLWEQREFMTDTQLRANYRFGVQLIGYCEVTGDVDEGDVADTSTKRWDWSLTMDQQFKMGTTKNYRCRIRVKCEQDCLDVCGASSFGVFARARYTVAWKPVPEWVYGAYVYGTPTVAFGGWDCSAAQKFPKKAPSMCPSALGHRLCIEMRR